MLASYHVCFILLVVAADMGENNSSNRTLVIEIHLGGKFALQSALQDKHSGRPICRCALLLILFQHSVIGLLYAS